MAELKLYEMQYKTHDGTVVATKYAYGEPWVEQALYMNDIEFDTPEEAKAYWFKVHGGQK
ncbi:MAG: hypothetical protein II659_04655 [Bacteroidales bacterium]|nr:hypothetical protein [Bacteroidales bacterium]